MGGRLAVTGGFLLWLLIAIGVACVIADEVLRWWYSRHDPYGAVNE